MSKNSSIIYHLYHFLGGGGALVLVDSDGTILSTAFEASGLEPLIRKALGLEHRRGHFILKCPLPCLVFN